MSEALLTSVKKGIESVRKKRGKTKVGPNVVIFVECITLKFTCGWDRRADCN